MKSEKMTSKSDTTKPFIFGVLRFLGFRPNFRKTLSFPGFKANLRVVQKTQKSTCNYPSDELKFRTRIQWQQNLPDLHYLLVYLQFWGGAAGAI